MPIFERKRTFSKKHNALMPIFGQKTSFLTKTRVICFKFCMKDPLLSYPYLVEKYQFCQYYSIVWPKKVNKMVFYAILHEKINARMPIFYQKYVYSLKKHTALKPIQCQNNFHSLNNIVFLFHFFLIFYEIATSVKPIIGQKIVNSGKTTLYYEPKSP